MSEGETELFMCKKEEAWNNSTESIIAQKVTKLTRSDSTFRIPEKLDSDATILEMELREINAEDQPEKITNWESIKNKSRFPKVNRTRSLLRDEMEILRINMSVYEKMVSLRDSQDTKEAKRKKGLKVYKFWKNHVRVFWDVVPKTRDLLADIEGSQNEYAQPARTTCPNCRFFITTHVKSVTTVRTKLTSLFFAAVGVCIIPRLQYGFEDTVHLCPLCRVYLGCSPGFGIRSRKATKCSTSSEEGQVEHPQLMGFNVLSRKMVSASSTSAKNLFVESKLRLCDRVQVNVNNIAAVARQIQRGSKANENLITAAKNFALQEAAIENSETNLKKLKLLTTHINNQLDSLHNSSVKMETVLEQVCSMQR